MPKEKINLELADYMTWDWREQPDPVQLQQILEKYHAAGKCGYITSIEDTGSDSYVWVFYTRPLEQDEAIKVFNKLLK